MSPHETSANYLPPMILRHPAVCMANVQKVCLWTPPRCIHGCFDPLPQISTCLWKSSFLEPANGGRAACIPAGSRVNLVQIIKIHVLHLLVRIKTLQTLLPCWSQLIFSPELLCSDAVFVVHCSWAYHPKKDIWTPAQY